VAAILRGGNASEKSFFYNQAGSISILRIEGKTVTRVKELQVGALPEPVCFTPAGRYLYVGNYLDQDFSILRVDGTEVVDTGKRYKVPGHPASARIGGR
jgi:DNA-binding beta-propeller fold protein YncE